MNNKSWFKTNPLGGRLTIVNGLNWGSEAKGAVIAGMMPYKNFNIAVRVGSHNAGHTAYTEQGEKVVVQTVPIAAALDPGNVTAVVGAGGSVNVEVLSRELLEIYGRTGVPVDLLIDGVAILNTPEHAAREKAAKMKDAIGSTCKGVGEGRVDKIRRLPQAVVGFDKQSFLDALGSHPAFEDVTITDYGETSNFLNNALMLGSNIMIEGTQGYLLSLSTSGYYPFCTSIECTPYALLADTGINHTLACSVEVVGVTRTYPIRVHGNSGEMGKELTWEEMSRITNGYIKEPEITTVTKLPRRIAELDYSLLSKAIQQTAATCLAVTFLDYLDPSISDEEHITEPILEYLVNMEKIVGIPVRYVGTGPRTHFPYNTNSK